MARRVSEAIKHAAALQAGRRMIARGERPGYRVSREADGSWIAVGLPGVVVVAESKRVGESMRAAIAAALEVDPAAFDLDG